MGRGIVAEFDAHVGLGLVRSTDGNEYPFHCTQIADGSRVIAVAADVDFEIVAGPLGRFEATAIRLTQP